MLLAHLRRLRRLHPDTDISYELMRGQIWFDDILLEGFWDINSDIETETVVSDGLWESLLRAVKFAVEKKNESSSHRRKRVHRKKSDQTS